MRFIPTRIHGMLDYLMGLLLIASPWIFGFDEGGAKQWLPVILGAGAIAYSLLTDYELGVVRLLPMPVHLALDLGSGLLLAVSPWLFGFNDDVWAPHLILGLLEARPRHGYELSKLIHSRSDGQLTFHIDSLYPLLYRLEERGWIEGKWVEKAGERRRRFYKVTTEGRRVLAQQRKTWATFVEAVQRITEPDHA